MTAQKTTPPPRLPNNVAGRLVLDTLRSVAKRLEAIGNEATSDFALANFPDGKTIHVDYSVNQFRRLIRWDNGDFAIVTYDYATQTTSAEFLSAAINRRDKAFEEHQYIIRACIKRNLPLIKALQLEVEDVEQDLSIRMLIALDRYDSERGSSLPSFLYRELQYEILDMSRRHRPAGITGTTHGKGIGIVYLDKPLENGTMFELPTTEDFSRHEVTDAINALPPDERSVTLRKVQGEPIRKRSEKEAFFRAREKLSACLCG